MTEPRELASAFAELTQTPPADAGKPPHLSRLLWRALALTGATAANVLTADGDEPQVRQATTAYARELIELELAAGSGPAVDCMRRGEPLGPVTVTGSAPWPHLAAAAHDAGYATAQAHPLRAQHDTGGRRPIGALVLYTRTPIDPLRRHITQALADTAATTIVTARRLTDQATRVQQLQRALDSRIVIEQAKGVLAERHRTSPEDAFTLLRRHARNNNRKLHDIATTVIASTRSAD